MITIYGAGAIGGLTGACLARAGEDVLMVDKVADHVEAMNRRGLRITGGADFRRGCGRARRLTSRARSA